MLARLSITIALMFSPLVAPAQSPAPADAPPAPIVAHLQNGRTIQLQSIIIADGHARGVNLEGLRTPRLPIGQFTSIEIDLAPHLAASARHDALTSRVAHLEHNLSAARTRLANNHDTLKDVMAAAAAHTNREIDANALIPRLQERIVHLESQLANAGRQVLLAQDAAEQARYLLGQDPTFYAWASGELARQREDQEIARENAHQRSLVYLRRPSRQEPHVPAYVKALASTDARFAALARLREGTISSQQYDSFMLNYNLGDISQNLNSISRKLDYR